VKTIAETRTGAVEGREKEGVILFAGIPYAAPPVAERRFRAAEPHASWSGVRPAKRFGPAAPQIPTGGLTSSAPVRWDEDCLTLNVSTPAVDDARRPVLVWIHGGGYRTGQGAIPWYNGARFAARGDIVVVSLNYRLGALGFSDLSRFGPEYATSGANGTLDQIVALEWVRDNVAAFGGDPDQVTIAGESAGGFSVATLLGTRRAAGLFRRVIAQSGAAHHTLPPAAGEQVSDALLAALGSSSIVELQRASVDDVLAAQAQVDRELGSGPGLESALGVPVAPFYPVVGNDVLRESPLDAIRAGLNADLPVLTGTNRDETTLWGYGDVDEGRLAKLAGAIGGDAELIRSYREARPGASAGELLIAITTDHMFRIPAVRLAEARAPYGDRTWMYLFSWESRAFGGRLGATHALEIPFAFDNLDRAGVDVFLGEGPRPQALADRMHAAWTAFIKGGDPSCDALPDWPAYTPERRATLILDEVCRLADDPSGAERLAWEGRR
jgi:para-nitrobenzyl esterase